MKLLLLLDIYGDTVHTQSIKTFLSLNAQVKVCSAYNEEKNFASQEEAYQFFQTHSGIEAYYEKARKHVEAFNPDVLIGFSVGGTVAWRLSEIYSGVSSCIAYYPSAIRHFLEVRPHVKTTVVFPSFEASFDVKQMCSKIQQLENVWGYVHESQHGFMNKLSPFYDEKACIESLGNIQAQFSE